MMMFWYGSHLIFWQAALMSLGMVIFWGLLIWGLYVLITGNSRHSAIHHPRLGDDARQILDQRLARGEIDLDQYHRLIEALGHDRPNSQTDMGASK
jgi:putative membrane protein